VIRWDPPGPYAVAFTTREGGVSEGPFASLNLGLATADAPDHVHENRRRAVAALGAEADALALNRQVHGARVVTARAGSRGEVEGDALWTEEAGVPVGALTADCVPIALARLGGDRPALAVVHAGWRGLLAGVVPAAVAALRGPVAAAIGPAIGPCCYELGDEVARPLRAAFGEDVVRRRQGDLRLASERALRAAGVDRVERLGGCTCCEPERYFSHRRDRGITGRQGVLGLLG
jgi:YfiH family protein